MIILLVEDDARVSNFIKKGLEEAGHHITVAYDGVMGLKLALENHYDLLILDGILPEMNGTELCKKIRQYKTNIPIIMLTALATIDDKLNGFNAGADDYLTKPFHFEELDYNIGRQSHVASRTVYPSSDTIYGR